MITCGSHGQCFRADATFELIICQPHLISYNVCNTFSQEHAHDKIT